MAELCPQCGADVRASGARCKSCGFWLPAAPAPRTGPPLARPAPARAGSQKVATGIIAGGGVVILALVIAGTLVLLRKPGDTALAPAVASAPLAAPSAAPARLEPSGLLAEARKRASAWHHDAVLVSLSASPLDARGVAPDGTVEFSYARPAGQRISGGAETGSERLTMHSSGGGLTETEARAGKSRVTPEPNCMFEDAWAAAQRAGAATSGSLRMRYLWSAKHSRPVWEVLSPEGEILRRLDGVTCSILTR